MKKSFYSHGKLLLSAEYLVLDSIDALALPTKKGQWLFVEESDESYIEWKSIDHGGNTWFHAKINLPLGATNEQKEDIQPILNDEKAFDISETLIKILTESKKLNPNFLSTEKGYRIETRLEFDRTWGLGSSSTLINNIAKWAKVDAFTLLENSFGGSGYDIAAAQYDHPILYNRNEGKPMVKEVSFDPSFKDHLFFIYLNQKQDSKASIKHYQSLPLKEFDSHEEIISKIIKTETVKSRLFPDYSRSIKSLGGWGGDFVLATGAKADMDYFKEKGYTTIISYSEMIL